MFVYTVVSWKSAHGQNTLQAHQRRSGHPFVFSHLTTKEGPCHVYRDLMPSKQITRQKIKHNRTSYKDGTMSLWPLVCATLVKSVYAKLLCNNLRWSITWCFFFVFTSNTHSACGCPSQTPQLFFNSHAWSSLPGGCSFTRLWYYQIPLSEPQQVLPHTCELKCNLLHSY